MLIIYGTIEGQTRKIARFMEEVLQDEGHKVTLANAIDEPPSAENYDAVLIGSSIHIHKYNSAVRHYVSRHYEALNNKPSAFYSVCMAVASELPEEHEEADHIAENFLDQTGWKPMMVQQIAGALKYTQYDFFKKWIMRRIAKKEGGSTDTSMDHEYTDWEAVRQFALDFAEKAEHIAAV